MDAPKLEHLGIEVNDLELVEKICTDLLGAPPFKREEVADEHVINRFFETSNRTKIELLPSTSPDGPIGRHIVHCGEGLHHMAFGVADLDAEIARPEGIAKLVGLNEAPMGRQLRFSILEIRERF